jgi:putative transposase
MMRTSAAEKLEIIRIVEESGLPMKQTLEELDVPRSTFYRWYERYQTEGYDGLVDRKPSTHQFGNRIPQHERDQVVEQALAHPELSPRELACHIVETQENFISESSVYRILKAHDLVTSPAFIVVTADSKFKHPTKRVNELWQTDFTQFKVVGWGWYYLSTILDDFSRFIIAYKLTTGMAATDVQDTLEIAVAKTGVTQVKVEHRPRLLSDNGPAYVSGELANYLKQLNFRHIRGKPYHPMTQGKIERYHRSLKNVICLENHYFPWELEQAIGDFIDYYNNQRYHEALNNLTPADVFFGRAKDVLSRREQIKRSTLIRRRTQHLLATSSA